MAVVPFVKKSWKERKREREKGGYAVVELAVLTGVEYNHSRLFKRGEKRIENGSSFFGRPPSHFDVVLKTRRRAETGRICGLQPSYITILFIYRQVAVEIANNDKRGVQVSN